jgi:hypothetical protein
MLIGALTFVGAKAQWSDGETRLPASPAVHVTGPRSLFLDGPVPKEYVPILVESADGSL